jgi:hypothetical protein
MQQLSRHLLIYVYIWLAHYNLLFLQTSSRPCPLLTCKIIICSRLLDNTYIYWSKNRARVRFSYLRYMFKFNTYMRCQLTHVRTGIIFHIARTAGLCPWLAACSVLVLFRKKNEVSAKR